MTLSDNIFIGGGISPWVGQPVVFVPGRHRDVFRADFDLTESPSYTWVLANHFQQVDASFPLCRDRDRRQLIGVLECVQPPSGVNPLAQARFAYINLGATLNPGAAIIAQLLRQSRRLRRQQGAADDISTWAKPQRIHRRV